MKYEKLLASIQISNNSSEKEAICIANIIKINNMLGLIDKRKKYLFSLADKCKLTIEQLHLNDDINKNKWCKEFLELYELIQSLNTEVENYQQILDRVKNANPGTFEQLDDNFNKYRGKIEFIDYIIKKHPYDNYENDKGKRDFKTYNPELLVFLMKKYQPDFYHRKSDEYDKKYCLYTEISSKLSNLVSNVT